VLIARRGDAPAELSEVAGRRAAFNSRDSLSGYVALIAEMREEGVPIDAVEWVETGSHRASVRAVAAGKADLAAIDAVCWALARRLEPDAAARLRVVGRTRMRPALPFITAKGRSDAEVEVIRAALAGVLAGGDAAEAARALGLTDVEVLEEAEYDPIAALAPEDQRAPSRASRG
jgi:ABC-type phosphate/phosphonate transport system substrate-binding protein